MGEHANPTVETTASDRDATADERDEIAGRHDQTADQRDALSEQRDARASSRDDASNEVDLDAAADRNAARRDRMSAKSDRAQARDDRGAAETDRSLSAADRAELLLDELTGFYRRAAGFLELEREITRAERTKHSFVLAFIDVDGLKAVNDSQGHEAGDRLLREVARCMRGVVREYDIFIRFGGDEFLCGIADLPVAHAAERFERANTELARSVRGSISVGLAERAPGEGLVSLIERADIAMYDSREPGRAQA